MIELRHVWKFSSSSSVPAGWKSVGSEIVAGKENESVIGPMADDAESQVPPCWRHKGGTDGAFDEPSGFLAYAGCGRSHCSGVLAMTCVGASGDRFAWVLAS